MGSGVSVPTDNEKVAQMLSVLPADELSRLKVSSPGKEHFEDKVPKQIKEKVARLVVSAMTPEGNVSMSTDILEHLHELPQVLSDVEQTSDPEARRMATEKIRRFLSVEQNPPIQVVIDAGCVPILVGFLNHNDDHQLQLEAGWALTNIASGNTSQTDAVILAGALPAFVKLLKTSRSVHVREQSIWALGNIAGDSAARRDLVIESDVLSPLLMEIIIHTRKIKNNHLSHNDETKFCDDDNEDEIIKKMEIFNKKSHDDRSEGILRNGAWLLSNLCRGRPRVSLDSLRPALPGIAALVEYVKDEEALSDALWAASYLSDGDQDNIDAVLCADVSSAHMNHTGAGGGGGRSPGGSLSLRLVELLSHAKEGIVTPALRCLGNLVTGDDASTEVVVHMHGCLEALRLIITAPKKTSSQQKDKRDANSPFSNLNEETKVFSAAIQKEACWTLSNMLAGTTSQIAVVFEAGLLPPLLSIANLDEKRFCKQAAVKNRRKFKGSFRVAPIGFDEGKEEEEEEEDDDDEMLKLEELKAMDGKAPVKQSDLQKEAVWAIANAASGATKKQSRQLIRAGSVYSLVSALYAQDPGVSAVAADGLTHLLRKAGGGKKNNFFFVRGSPAYRWRNRIIRTIKSCDGFSALKKMISQGTSTKRGSKNNKNIYQVEDLQMFASSNNKYSKEVLKEAAMKAQALLSLVSFTRALLMRARKEAKLGNKQHTKLTNSNLNSSAQLFEVNDDDADNEEDDEDDEDDIENDPGNFSDDDDEDEEEDAVGKSFDSGGSNPHRKADDDFMDEEFGDFDYEQEAKPIGGRVITITPSKKPSFNDYSNYEDGETPGQVQVRRLGPGGGEGAGRDEELLAAMESLQRDLSAVGLNDAKPKRGWTRAWDV